jgi:hypothetical protein
MMSRLIGLVWAASLLAANGICWAQQAPLDGVEYHVGRAGGGPLLGLPWVTLSAVNENDGRQRLLDNLEILPVGDYDGEVLRYVGPAPDAPSAPGRWLVVQFAKLGEGDRKFGDVQVLVVLATRGRTGWSSKRWRGYIGDDGYRLTRIAAINALVSDAIEPDDRLNTPIVCFDGPNDSLEFHSKLPVDLTISRNGDCEDSGPVRDAAHALIAAAERTLGIVSFATSHPPSN